MGTRPTHPMQARLNSNNDIVARIRISPDLCLHHGDSRVSPAAPHGMTARLAATVLLLLLLLLSAVVSPFASADDEAEYGKAVFFEPFNPGWEERWSYSKVKKYKGRFDTVQQEALGDTAIQMPAANVHYGLAALLPSPLAPSDGLVVQYEVRFTQGHSCGGAYLKLLSAPGEGEEPINPRRMAGKSPYSIMFGPDRCGPDARVHLILHARHPLTGEVLEHHLMSAPEPKKDKLSHLYSLVLASDRYKLLIDGQEVGSGPLATADFSPPLQPPETIPDPDDVKPEDWVEEEMMDDPDAVKPAGWDDRRVVPDLTAKKPMGWLEHQPLRVPNTAAQQPDDWDEASLGPWQPGTVPNPACEDAVGCGPWKPPMVRNPGYKGPWIPPQIKNPAYKGEWQQHVIANPGYYKVDSPLELLAPVAGVALELWTTDAGYRFDGLLLGQGQPGMDAAKTYLNKVWRPRHKAEYAAAVAAARDSSPGSGWRYVASNLLLDLAAAAPLARLQPRLQPLLDVLRGSPEAGWTLLVLPAATTLLLVATGLRGSAKGSAAEEDGAGDELQQEEEFEVDDQEWEAEQKKISREAAAAAKRREAAAAAGSSRQQQPGDTTPARPQRRGGRKSAAAAAAGDGVDGDGDEGPDDTPAVGSRRSARRPQPSSRRA